MVVAQMNEWEYNPCPDPVDGKPNGQKCKIHKENTTFWVGALRQACHKGFERKSEQKGDLQERV